MPAACLREAHFFGQSSSRIKAGESTISSIAAKGGCASGDSYEKQRIEKNDKRKGRI
jgi:hypothetical protein